MKRPLPERYVVLTVDDAYLSFLNGALPLLRRHKVPVTLFVSTSSVGAEGYLTWDQLRQLAEEGVELGGHSHSHPHYVNLWLEHGIDVIDQDLRRTIREFEINLDLMPVVFAYPFGETLPEISQRAARAGFTGGVVQHSGVVHDGADVMHLPRFAMAGPYADIEGFIEKVNLKPLKVKVLEPPHGLLSQRNPPSPPAAGDSTWG